MHTKIKFIYAILIITLVGASVTLWLVRVVQKSETMKNQLQNVPVSEPTDFLLPSSPTTLHSVGAVIEPIYIPAKQLEMPSTADIVKSMNGVPDATILKINEILTQGLFDKVNGDSVDVRIPANRKSIPGEQAGQFKVYAFDQQIVYLDKNIIVYGFDSDIQNKGDIQSHRDYADYGYIEISNDGKTINPDPMVVNGDDAQKILLHFYPNFNQILSRKITAYNSDERNFADDGCYTTADTSADFESVFRPDIGELVFTKHWANDIQCQVDNGEISSLPAGDEPILVAIPISKLKEVSQYIPADSILRRFMDNK